MRVRWRLADVTAAAGDEVIVADNLGAGGWLIQGQIKVFPANAAAPITIFPSLPTTFYDTVVTLADLTGDGVPEILALASGPGGDSDLLYAWTSTGALVSGNFPVAVAGTNWASGFTVNANRLLPLLSKDGHSELLVAARTSSTSFCLKKYAADGKPVAWPTRTFNGYLSQMASGDVDGDGRREIVVCYWDGTYGFIEVLSPDGVTLPGWPVRFPSGVPWPWLTWTATAWMRS